MFLVASDHVCELNFLVFVLLVFCRCLHNVGRVIIDYALQGKF
jgi:hypothetical protein